jgi:hypothetical protein
MDGRNFNYSEESGEDKEESEERDDEGEEESCVERRVLADAQFSYPENLLVGIETDFWLVEAKIFIVLVRLFARLRFV